MTADQFAALAELLSLRPGPAREAARLVLVDEMRPADAAVLLGISPQAASNAIGRAKRGLALARQAAGA